MTYFRGEVRLRDIPKAGAWAYWFAILGVVSFALAGFEAAAGGAFWTAVLTTAGVANIYALDHELREVNA